MRYLTAALLGLWVAAFTFAMSGGWLLFTVDAPTSDALLIVGGCAFGAFAGLYAAWEHLHTD